MAVCLITETVPKCLMDGECVQRGYSGKGMIHVLDGTEQVGVRVHGATQNGVQFKT